MAKIGSIYLGGKDFPESASEHFSCGIAFQLKDKSEINHVWNSYDSNWEIEIKQNHYYVVARSHKVIGFNDLVTGGLEQIQRCFDVLAVEKIGIFGVYRPEIENIAVFKDNGHYVLHYSCVHSLGIATSVSVEVRDKDGNVRPPNPIPEPTWTWAFRYYRLSQNSQDVFEAYRNLFLSLEALLNEICPKQSTEGERGWLIRALSTVESKVNLTSHVPNSINQSPINYLMKTQYAEVRCRLFHAKFPDALLPHAELNPNDVFIAYEALLRLWHSIAEAYFNVPKGGSAFTYQGFKCIMDGLFAKPLSIHFTEDNSPAGKEDTAISPLGIATFKFSNPSYLSQTKPGIVTWTGQITLSDIHKALITHRICTKVDNKLVCVDSIKDGISLTGVDSFETYQSMRLVNKSQPKTTF